MEQNFEVYFNQIEGQCKQFIEQKGYKLIKVLGKGTFSQVWQVKEQNEDYAVKILIKRIYDEIPQLLEYLQAEIQILKQANHENVVKIYKAMEDENSIYMVMEYCEQNLLQYLKDETKQKGFSEQEALKIFLQILSGMHSVNQMGYIHRDLKPENILLKGKQLKICDFGFAKKIQTGKLASTYCGSEEFMAPEIHKKIKYNHKVDIWSMGVILFVLIFYKFPFKSTNIMDQIMLFCGKEGSFSFELYLDNSKSKKNQEKFSQVSTKMKQFISALLTVDFEKRIDYKTIYQLPIFNDIDEPKFHINKQQYEGFYEDFEKQQVVSENLQQIDKLGKSIMQKKSLIQSNNSRPSEIYLNQIPEESEINQINQTPFLRVNLNIHMQNI